MVVWPLLRVRIMKAASGESSVSANAFWHTSSSENTCSDISDFLFFCVIMLLFHYFQLHKRTFRAAQIHLELLIYVELHNKKPWLCIRGLASPEL